jgi:molybdenum cofactor guanylyltransferase
MISTEPDNQVLNGLVLAGGKSSRMGRDKGVLLWHGKEQRFFMADLLQQFCNEVFISCRQDQVDILNGNYNTITDAYTGLGPYGAILSAFKKNSSCAWLVVACDLPLLNASTLEQLVVQRDPNAMATTFESPHDGLPEPLITIWEPKSYPILLASLSKGYQCPRKALINNNVKIVQPVNKAALMNVNTPQELEKAQRILDSNKVSEDAK